jgi:hypothetical protein
MFKNKNKTKSMKNDSYFETYETFYRYDGVCALEYKPTMSERISDFIVILKKVALATALLLYRGV